MSWTWILLLFCSLSIAQTVTKQTNNPQTPLSASEVLNQINKYRAEDLSKLTFMELYVLKNAVLANKGYKFADDRSWLRDYFYGEYSIAMNCGESESDEFSCNHHKGIKCADCPTFNLRLYTYPQVQGNTHFKQTQEMEQAFAKIRQAGLLKIRKFTSGSSLLEEFNRQNQNIQRYDWSGAESDGLTYQVFMRDLGSHAEYSIRRDLMGDFSLVNLLEQFKSSNYDFDKAELLGLYLGNLDLLRKAILSLHGKEFPEPLKSELAALGVTAKPMTVGNLSKPAEKALGYLDEAIKTLVHGNMSDLPESFKTNKLNVDDSALSYSLGM